MERVSDKTPSGRSLLSDIAAKPPELVQKAVHPAVPRRVPGQLEGVAGRAEGQEVSRGGHHAAVGADCVVGRCPEGDSEPARGGNNRGRKLSNYGGDLW